MVLFSRKQSFQNHELGNEVFLIYVLGHIIVVKKNQLAINTSNTVDKCLSRKIFHTQHFHLFVRRIYSFDLMSSLNLYFRLWNYPLTFKLFYFSNLFKFYIFWVNIFNYIRSVNSNIFEQL